MKRIAFVTLFIGALAVVAQAQNSAPDDNQRDQRDRLRSERGPGPGGDGQRGGPRGPRFDRMFERVAEQLDLDEDQRAKFDEIASQRREEMREIGQRWREVREAERDGDQERAAQLRAELPERRGAGMSDTLSELEPMLRPDQLTSLWEIQDRMTQRREHFERYRAIRDELPDELDLDDKQREDFQQLLDEGRQRMRERRGEMRPLFEEMREASEAGDDERVAELRQQFEDSRPDVDALLDEFLSEVEGFLTDSQKEKLAEYRVRLNVVTGDAKTKAEPRDIREVLRAARRLRLEGDQKIALHDIERDAAGEYRETDRRNKDEQAKLAASVRDQIAEMLDSDQVGQFEEALERVVRRGRR